MPIDDSVRGGTHVRRVLAIPASIRAAIGIITGLLVSLFVVMLVAMERPLGESALLFSVCALPTILIAATFMTARLIVHSDGIVYQTLWRVRRIVWDEVIDLQVSPRLIAVSTPRERLRLFRGAYGLSLEPFEELQAEAERRLRRLIARWEAQALPVVFRCMGMGLVAQVAYAFVIGLALLLAAVPLIVIPAAWPLSLGVLVVSAAAICPWLIRDHRRGLRQFIVDGDGLRQRNGADVLIPWRQIQHVEMFEPGELGWGVVIVRGGSGTMIQIPRSLPAFGKLWYWVRRFSPVQEEYQR